MDSVGSLSRENTQKTDFSSTNIHTLLIKNECSFDRKVIILIKTTFNNGSLGSRIDEERSEMR